MTSLGHHLINNKEYLIYSKNTHFKPELKKSKCTCINCRVRSTEFKFNTTACIPEEEAQFPYIAQNHHLVRVSNQIEEFWANSRCLQDDWVCACFRCKAKREKEEEAKANKKKRTVDTTDSAEEELTIKFSSFTVTVSKN